MSNDEMTVILLPILGIALILLIIGVFVNIFSRKKIIPDDVRQQVIEARPANPSAMATAEAYETTAVAAPANQSVSTIIIVLLVIMGLFWLFIAFTQFSLGSMTTNLGLETGGDALTFYLYGIWNIFISIVNLWMIKGVVRRRKIMVRDLTFLGIVGSLWGGYQLVVDGAFIQACAVPLYIILAVLIQINKREYVNP